MRSVENFYALMSGRYSISKFLFDVNAIEFNTAATVRAISAQSPQHELLSESMTLRGKNIKALLLLL
jgi:hypothetical protein